MNKRVFFIAAFLLLFTISSAVTALPGTGGYVVEPATDDMYTGEPLETVQIEWWQVPPRILIISWLCMFCPVLVCPVELIFVMKVFAYLGYRKIVQKNVLNNPSREAIFQYIRKTPGTDFSEISRQTGVSPNSLRYHLSILKLMNKVTVLNTSRNSRYYENSGRYSAMEQKVLKYLHNKPTRTLLRLLTENPGMNRVQLGTAIGISGAGITWQMKRLSDDGLLVIRKAGRTARYELTMEAIPFLEKYLPDFDEKSVRNTET